DILDLFLKSIAVCLNIRDSLLTWENPAIRASQYIWFDESLSIFYLWGQRFRIRGGEWGKFAETG
ncbi:MAG: hypothetical protein DMG06_03660, partial [Acidobacteria bacterium]